MKNSLLTIFEINSPLLLTHLQNCIAFPSSFKERRIFVTSIDTEVFAFSAEPTQALSGVGHLTAASLSLPSIVPTCAAQVVTYRGTITGVTSDRFASFVLK
jgi:hypothetical protein